MTAKLKVKNKKGKALRASCKGFTLVETLVVISLYTIMGFVVVNSIASFYRFNAYSIAQSYQVSNARKGVELLVRDMREMTFADDGAFPVIGVATSSISFYSDIDRDDSVELVTYTLASTTLYKYVYDATGDPPVYSTASPDQTFIISEYVQNLLQGVDIFTYYDENGVETTAASSVTDVRYADVQLIINIDPIRSPGEFMLRSSASFRNLQ